MRINRRYTWISCLHGRYDGYKSETDSQRIFRLNSARMLHAVRGRSLEPNQSTGLECPFFFFTVARPLPPTSTASMSLLAPSGGATRSGARRVHRNGVVQVRLTRPIRIRRLAIGATAMTKGLNSKLHDLRQNNRDWLLTLLTAVLTLMIFVFAPLQAAGIFLFQTFAIAGLLVIIGGALIISGKPIALWLMSIAFIANFSVFFFRLYYPWPYNLHLLAGAWFVIAITLGIVVARAVFGGGRITYHRIVGAILLYLLIAVTFATLF